MITLICLSIIYENAYTKNNLDSLKKKKIERYFFQGATCKYLYII